NGTNGTNGTSCTVTDNGDGTKTISCEDGTEVTVANGQAGKNGGNVQVTNFHGREYLFSSGLYANGAKQLVKATITGASANASGAVSVDFNVQDSNADPVKNVTAIRANIAKLVPHASAGSFNKWVPYIYRNAVAGTGEWNSA